MQSPVNSNFHLYFLIQLSRYLGFYPTENYSETNSIFNLQDGMFQSSMPIHPFYIENSSSPLFNELIKLSLNFSSDIKIHINERRILIEKILQYYSLHIGGFGETKSHKVLEEILS
jgi:DNA repair protein RecO (recombination protein O)